MLSLTVALIVWSLSIRTVDFRVNTPLRVTYLTDDDGVILGQPPESVLVGFQGDGLTMLGFQLFGGGRRLDVTVDIRGKTPDSVPETQRITLNDTSVGQVPMGIVTTDFEPSLLEFSLDRITVRTLPVSIRTDSVPSRYMIVVSDEPGVRVRGPVSVLNTMDSLSAGPVSILSDREQYAPLQLPDGATADAAFVTVTLRRPVSVVRRVSPAY